MSLLIALIFILAFALVWSALWYLLRHPEINFHLEGKAMAHEPTLDEVLIKIKVFLHEEEAADISEVASLLHVDMAEAEEYLSLLVERGKVVVDTSGSTTQYKLR